MLLSKFFKLTRTKLKYSIKFYFYFSLFLTLLSSGREIIAFICVIKSVYVTSDLAISFVLNLLIRFTLARGKCLIELFLKLFLDPSYLSFFPSAFVLPWLTIDCADYKRRCTYKCVTSHSRKLPKDGKPEKIGFLLTELMII